MATPQRPAQTTNQASKQSTNQGAGQSAAQHKDTNTNTAAASARETQVPIGADRDQSRNTADKGNRATAAQSSAQQYLPPNGFNQRAASPLSLMRALTEEMDRLFEGFAFVPPRADPLFGVSGYPTARSIGSGPQRNLTAGATSRSPSVRSQGGQTLTQRGAFFPEIELLQRGDNLVVRADLPGLKKEDIRVDCEDGALRLSGTRTEESTDEGDGYFHSERTYGNFARVIPLPKEADQAACKAKFENGVLEVTVPLPKEKAKSRQIDIQ